MATMAMKLVAALAVLLVATAHAATNSSSAAGNATVSTLCDSQLLFQKLYVLMPAINQCATESDYFISPSNLSLPSDASLAKFCASQNCSQLSVELDNAGLPSCTVPVGNSTMPFKVFFKEIKDHCEAAKTPSNPSSSSRLVVSLLLTLLAVSTVTTFG